MSRLRIIVMDWARVVKTGDLGGRVALGYLLRHDLDISWLPKDLQFCPQCQSWWKKRVPMSNLWFIVMDGARAAKTADLGARVVLGVPNGAHYRPQIKTRLLTVVTAW